MKKVEICVGTIFLFLSSKQINGFVKEYGKFIVIFLASFIVAANALA